MKSKTLLIILIRIYMITKQLEYFYNFIAY